MMKCVNHQKPLHFQFPFNNISHQCDPIIQIKDSRMKGIAMSFGANIGSIF